MMMNHDVMLLPVYVLSRQAVSKDLTSSSKFSGSCVLTLQTLLLMNVDGSYVAHDRRGQG